MTLTIGSLFSGIGGLELGLERAGLGPVLFQVEKDPFCRAVLAKHWPDVPRFEDVREVGAELPRVDLLCGGFPCQDVSSAGARAGLGGERSGLWFEYRRIIEAIRPSFVVVENVESGARLWLRPVREQLCGLGYRTRALGIAASDVGAPHRRRRIFVVAHADREGKPPRSVDAEVARAPAPHADVAGVRANGPAVEGEERRRPWTEPQPPMVRVVHGVSRAVDRARRRALGNAVVPQCAEVVGRVIVAMLTGSNDGNG